MKLLFVCTGNTCRSPMAEGFAKEIFKNDDVSSAGLCVNSGDCVSQNSVDAMRDFAIDISRHRPTQLTLNMANDADYIVPMTQSHKMILLSNDVDENKILMFDEQISDPYGQSLEVYKQCAKQIKRNVELLYNRIYENN